MRRILSVCLLCCFAILSIPQAYCYFHENFDNDGALSQWRCEGDASTRVVSGQWRTMTARFNSGAEKRILLHIRTDSGSMGKVWIDNFQSKTALESLTNASFEEGTNGWSCSEGVVLDDTRHSHGSKCVCLDVPLDSSPSRILQRWIDVTPDTEYEISLDMLVDDAFQGDCKYLVFDPTGMRCIMKNYGEPFACNVIADRDRNGKGVATLKASQSKNVSISRDIELEHGNVDLMFSLMLCPREFKGDVVVSLIDKSDSSKICELKPQLTNGVWQTVNGLGVAKSNRIELRIEAVGQEGGVDLDNIRVTPPSVVPELQYSTWMKASNNLVLPTELTFFFGDCSDELIIQTAMEMFGKDLAAIGKKARIVNKEEEAIIRFSIDMAHSCWCIGDEGYFMEIRKDGVNVRCCKKEGAFYAMMTLMELVKPYNGVPSLPEGDILDYPTLPVRGIMTSESPEACARKKLNLYLFSTGYPQTEAEKKSVGDIMQNCRKYNLKPVPYVLTSTSSYFMPTRDPNCSIGRRFNNELVQMRGNKPVELQHPFVIRSKLTDIVVRNADGKKTYKEGKDYCVIDGYMQWPFPQGLDMPEKLPKEIRRFAIARVKGSSIKRSEKVLVSYDAVVNWRPPYCPLEPKVAEENRVFFHDYMRRDKWNWMLAGMDFMEFQEAEALMKQDSRVIKSGRTPAELIAEDMVSLVKMMKEVDSDAKLLFFTGANNDVCRQAAPILKKSADDFIAIVWGYDANWASAFGIEAVKFWSSQGISSITMPWDNARNVQGMAQLAKQSIIHGLLCHGMIGSSWGNRKADLTEVAQNAWRAPREGEPKYVKMEMDSDDWTTMKREWKEHIVIAPGKRNITARMLLLETPKTKIMAVPILNYMPEKKRLILTFNSEYAEQPRITHYAMKMFSDDFGEHWSLPERLDTSTRLGFNSMTRYLSDGKLVAYPQESTIERYVFQSLDFGQTWKRMSKVRTPEGAREFWSWDPPMYDNGKLYETGYMYKTRPDGKRVICAYYRISDDGGKTYGPDIFPPQWEGINEITLFRCRSGRFIGMGRKENYNAENDQSDSLVVSISDDGVNWSAPIDVRPAGRMHPSMVELPDRLIMTYVVRNGYDDTPDGYPRFGIEAVESFDGGKTWSKESYILAQFVSEYMKGKEKWAASVQSTNSLLLPNGEIMTVFGTAHRARWGYGHRQMPRDLGIVKWKVSE